MSIDLPLLIIFFVVALLHSSVGLAGGSSYTAFMAIFGLPLVLIPSISLSLNTLVSAIGSINFIKNRHFNMRLWLPCQLSALPFVYLGARTPLPAAIFYAILLVTLAISLWRLNQMRQKYTLTPLPAQISHSVNHFDKANCDKQVCCANQVTAPVKQSVSHPSSMAFTHHTLKSLVVCVLLGAVLGFLSGSIGIGGGIYLIPSIVLLKLGSIKQASCVGVVFILFNSVLGLFSKWQLGQTDMSLILPALAVVAIGGTIGSYLGASRLPTQRLLQLLMMVMGIACILLSIKLYQSLL